MIAKHEGILALQSGIASALAFQVVLNGIRLGSYKIGRTYGLTQNEQGQTNILKTVLLSGLAGCVGAVLASPFYLVIIFIHYFYDRSMNNHSIPFHG